MENHYVVLGCHCYAGRTHGADTVMPMNSWLLLGEVGLYCWQKNACLLHTLTLCGRCLMIKLLGVQGLSISEPKMQLLFLPTKDLQRKSTYFKHLSF